jgi:hypothetical protein
MTDATTPMAEGRERAERNDRIGSWIRRVSVCLLSAVVVLALCNVAGQRASVASLHNPIADLSVHAPATVRPGLLFQTKISVTAHKALPDVQLVLGSGWFDGLTLNTAEPSASTQTSGPGGSVMFDVGPLQAGETYVQYLEYQVNPTSLSRRDQVVSVRSRGVQIVSMHHTLTIVP